MVDCQDDDIKDVFDNDDKKDDYFHESQLTLQNSKNAYDMIYCQLSIDNIKKWVVIEQQLYDCEAKLKKQRYSQLTTREQSRMKQKISDLTKEWQNSYLNHDHYIYKLTDEAVFHARESIMIVRQNEVMEVKMKNCLYKQTIQV